MKIALIGPGILPIPPPGWGAVEILIWDYYNELTSKGHDVTIINKIRNHPNDQSHPYIPYCMELINEINKGEFDFVHLHYDCLYHIIPFLTARKIGFTSHYPYIDQLDKHMGDGFSNIFNYMVTIGNSNNNSNIINFVLADKDIECLKKHYARKENIIKLENGISHLAFLYKPLVECIHLDKTIYLGKVTDRKGQHKYCHLAGIHIIGPSDNPNGLVNYMGSWTREQVFGNLCNYGNLLLLSDGEADPLVVKEAMIAGLGVVINETSGKNLDRERDFITFIPNEKINDLEYIQTKLDENRQISIQKRDIIRQYAIAHFGWEQFIQKYIDNITNHTT
jgi:glycosyltransferase involved in cell wall biosynthesis